MAPPVTPVGPVTARGQARRRVCGMEGARRVGAGRLHGDNESRTLGVERVGSPFIRHGTPQPFPLGTPTDKTGPRTSPPPTRR